MSSRSKNGDGNKSRLNKRAKYLALATYRNQTVRRVTTKLIVYEDLPRLTRTNAERAGLKIVKRAKVPAGLTARPFKGKKSEQEAAQVARAAGFDVVTYQQITVEAQRAAGV